MRATRRAFALLGTVQATLIFTITLVAVPLPAIGREFGLGTSGLVLVSAAYGLAFSGLLLFGGRLADRLGGRRLLGTGLIVFAAASAAAAAAPDAAVLIAARFAEGTGAALTAPAAMAVLPGLFPDPARHGRAMATWGGLSVLGATAGIVLSGVVTTWLSWRWMFVLAALAGGTGRLLAPRWLPAAGPRRRSPLDLPGAVLATAGVSLLSYGLVVSGGRGWARAPVTVPIGVGLALLAAFAVTESRRRDPLLPPAFLADRRRLAALAAIAVSAAGTSAAFLLLSLYLQQVRGWPPLRTSLAFAPYALALVLAGRAASRSITRFGARRVLLAGLAAAAAGLLLLAPLAPRTGYLTGLLPGLVLLPAGAALVFAAAAVLATSGTPPQQAGLAGGVMNTAMELGPTAGLAVLVTIAAARTARLTAAGAAPLPATTGGYAWALGAAGLAFALLIPATLAAHSSQTRPSQPQPEGVTVNPRFTGQHVLVTGAGSGIGREIALAFAGEDAAVTVAGRTAEPLRQTVKLIEAGGGRATAITADITRSDDVARLLAAASAAHGPVGVAVNNAGVLTAAGPVGDIDEDQWATLVSVNLTGTLLSMKHEIAHMRGHGGGVIVNVSSTLGTHKRLPGLGGYVATKAAVSALTRNAALDHIGEGIRINAVSPGSADTPMSMRPGESTADRDARMREQNPAGRVASLAEVAAAVLYLASPQAAVVVGTDLVIDGGAAA